MASAQLQKPFRGGTLFIKAGNQIDYLLAHRSFFYILGYPFYPPYLLMEGEVYVSLKLATAPNPAYLNASMATSIGFIRRGEKIQDPALRCLLAGPADCL